jgi:hypothetical protein
MKLHHLHVALEITMLSEVSLTQKDKYHVFSHVWNLDLKSQKQK